ncbi:MAG: hypothetical protein IPP15_06895 [Saprospiraceae bacterium]|uniref:Alpha/beta hydrolase n=1 Tax=Candidatus Opimibacter skivensis TaxID=2982028 RepID=A0A9D7SS92_9BACT|nr:hypothetical protein [Candidatus Opimibacter skivensis]
MHHHRHYFQQPGNGFLLPWMKIRNKRRIYNLPVGLMVILSYLKNELIPDVDEKYRTISYRLLIGHSTGGLLAYYSLYKTPGLFHAILSIDGSTWWNKGKVGKEVIEYLSSHP